jgi:TonB family protein
MGTLRKLSPAIFSSVILHGFFLALFAVWMTQAHVAPASGSKYIMIEVDPLPKAATPDDAKTRQQVVQTEKSDPAKTAAPDSYLGEQTQRVEHQTVSMPKIGSAATASKAVPKASVITATGALAKFGIAIGTGKENSPRPKELDEIEQGSLSAQARGEYVKGFKEGEKTLLNTREFVFYGYFQRIREKLDRAWDQSLREHLKKYFYRGRQLASETDYTTQMLVSLDKAGRIKRVKIITASGTTDLDEAATRAFNDAGPFPNPPTGLVDNSGEVLVRWDFVLRT